MKNSGIRSFVMAGALCALAVSCASGTKAKDSKAKKILYKYENDETENPLPFENNTEALDFIFDNNVLGKTTITIPRSEWDTMLENYDSYYKNEIYVHADYRFEKGGKRWTMPDSGFRLRGNTTRVRPQGPDYTHSQGNHKWSNWQGLQGASEDKYRQSSFKVSFDKFLSDDATDEQKDAVKMAGCLKGMNLKRFQGDAAYIREIYSLDFMRHNGVWTAPRASYTRLIIQIFEDTTDGTYSILNYGIYEMFEEVGKQSLSERSKKTADAWTSTKGNLWKCQEKSDFTPYSIYKPEKDIGIDVLTANAEESRTYRYCLKTNKKNLETASAELTAWINELAEIDVLSEGGIEKAKAWFDSHMEVDLFLRTMACNVILGMDDDYWGNGNNFYLYFDTSEKGTGKLYMIPFDYDHTFGNPVSGDPVNKNPLAWGKASGARPMDRPLMDKLIAIPEYKELYKKYLMEFTAPGSYWAKENSQERIRSWHKQIENYVASPSLIYDHDTTKRIVDNGGYAMKRYFLLQEPNVWDGKRKAIEKAVGK